MVKLYTNRFLRDGWNGEDVGFFTDEKKAFRQAHLIALLFDKHCYTDESELRNGKFIVKTRYVTGSKRVGDKNIERQVWNTR